MSGRSHLTYRATPFVVREDGTAVPGAPFTFLRLSNALDWAAARAGEYTYVDVELVEPRVQFIARRRGDRWLGADDRPPR